ncbi:Hypothetical protein GLP15_2153 [Giardia lamblia P15]|uniref:Uncharacterized protein n=1 Tax=Giardia intestinalis (strain P15) TaxID=658858 RepID=E1F6Z3_GIAIA|nr:Hypothetical protein GLP15_2153 [Giardia lamblia P15]
MKGCFRPDVSGIVATALQACKRSHGNVVEMLHSVSAQISPVSGSLSSQTICQECGHSTDSQTVQYSLLEIETPAVDADPLTASHENYAVALSETAYYTRVLVLPPHGSPIFNFRLLSSKLSATYLQNLITSTLRLPPGTPLAALSIDKEIIGLADIFAEDDDTSDQDRSASLERYCRLNFGANHCLIVAPVLPEELPTGNKRDVVVDIFIQDSAESVSIPLIVCSDNLDSVVEIVRRRLALFYSDEAVRNSILSQDTLLSLTLTTECSFKCVVHFDASINPAARSHDLCSVFRSSPRVFPVMQYTLKDCIENFLKERLEVSLVCPNCRAKGSMVVQKTLVNQGKILPVLILNSASHILLQDIIAFDSSQYTVVLAILQDDSGELLVANKMDDQLWSIDGETRSLAELQSLSCVFFTSIEKRVSQED